MAVYLAMLQPGDTLMGMELSHGGHLTHGHPLNFSGKYFKIVSYGVHPETEQIDYDRLAQLAAEHKPKMIASGASNYSRVIDWNRLRAIADSVGAYLFADIAHYAGLVAAGVYPSPVAAADFVATTTHKTLRGPRGGVILCKEKYAKDIDRAVFPGVQGGPLMHVIAAKAVAFGEALKPAFKKYAVQVRANARALAAALAAKGFRIVSGGTDCHVLSVDLRSKAITGKDAEVVLGQAGITVNKNTIPFETRSPFQASGIRLGTPAVTTRGMKEPEMAAVADMISEALMDIKSVDTLAKVRDRVRELTARFPLPY
jgi:glycine hydroxymethyltransferase